MESEHNSSLKVGLLWACVLFMFVFLVPSTVPGTLTLSNNVDLIESLNKNKEPYSEYWMK